MNSNFKEPTTLDLQNAFSFVATQRQSVLIGCGEELRSSAPTPDNVSFYFPDFFLEEQLPWRYYQTSFECSLKSALKLFKKHASDSPPKFQWEFPDFKEWKNSIDEIQELIRIGSLEKAVPYLFVKDSRTLDFPTLCHCASKAVSHTMHYGGACYGYWDGKTALIGATPELLVAGREGNINTVACAATALHPEQLEGIKEQHEHALVIKGLLEALTPYGQVICSEPKVISTGKLYHLWSSLQVNMEYTPDLIDCVHSLHPTPALGAYPRSLGSLWLKNYNLLHPRNHYGAPVGYLEEDGSFCCHVGIRQLQWHSNQLRLGAGCGITAGSDAFSEWNEWRAKIQTTATSLGLNCEV